MEIRETVECLNELLEVERVGVTAAEDLIPLATSPAMSRLFGKLRDDEGWSCAGLMRVIRHLGGRVSSGQSELGGPLETVPSLRERLASLNRRQTWVLRRLDRVLEEDVDRESGGFLRQMRSLHAENVHRCEELIRTLPREESRARGHGG